MRRARKHDKCIIDRELLTLRLSSVKELFNMILIGDEKGNQTEVDFFVDENNTLQPLEVLVTRDNRYDFLPQTRDNSEEVPGMHGEIDFGTELKGRFLELDIVSIETECFTKKELQYLYAKYFDPTKGYKSLVFADDIEKVYYVKYSGRIDVTNYANWFKFTIPFKMKDPFIYGTFEKSLVGNGKIKNEGTFETGLIIEISGAITNPSVTIGTDILTYTGTITSGNTLVIDTLKKTVKIGNNNAVNNFNSVFPLLPADTELNVVAGSNVKIKWRNKWL